MTLVIAHRDGWMIADRRIMESTHGIGSYNINKIQRHTRLPLLVGCAGSMGNVGLVRELLDELETEVESVVIKQVANICRQQDGKNDSSLLILTPTKLVEVDSGGGIFHLLGKYGAVGSGTQEAMSWMSGRCHPRHFDDGPIPLGLSIAKVAVAYVSSVNAGVGDGIQVETISGYSED